MAGTKRKSDTARPSPNKKTARTGPSQRVKPSVEYIEISSDIGEQSRISGPGRGLNGSNIISAAATQLSVEQEDLGGDTKTPIDNATRHMTRGSRHGRTDKSKYDMKYHPMDEVTRPKSAAQRRSGWRSLSAITFGAEGCDTSDAIMPSEAKGSDEESSDGETSINTSPERKPDPRATRHSMRAEAKKSVNYSRKHHPQDDGLPGHQHRAKKSKRAEKKRKRSGRASPSPPKNEVVVCDSEDEDVILEQEDELEPKHPSNPQKKLRMLSDQRRSSPQRPKKGRTSKTKAVVASKHSNDPLATLIDSDLDAFIDTITDTSVPLPSVSSDDLEVGQEPNGMDGAEATGSDVIDLRDADLDRPIAGINMLASDTEEDPQDFVKQMQSQRNLYGSDVDSAVDDEEDAASTEQHSESDRSEADSCDTLYVGGEDADTILPLQLLDSARTPAARDRSSTQPSGRVDAIDSRGRAEHVAGGRSVGTARPLTSKNVQFVQPHENGSALARLPSAKPLSTAKGNTRVESSSSTFKASIRVNSELKSSRPESDGEDQEQAEGSLHSQSRMRPELDTADMDMRSLIHTQYLDGTSDTFTRGDVHFGRTPSSKSGSLLHAALNRPSDRHTSTVRAVHLITPLTSFKDPSFPRPVSSTAIAQRRGTYERASDLFGDTTRSQVASIGSQGRLRSPRATPRLPESKTQHPPKWRWEGTLGDALNDDDDDDASVEDMQSSDPATPTGTSSPSRLVDVVS